MDERNVDELLQKMHEKKAETADYLQKKYSEEELVKLEKQLNQKIRHTRLSKSRVQKVE